MGRRRAATAATGGGSAHDGQGATGDLPFGRLELAYLYEVGKVTAIAEAVLADLGPKLELVVADVSAAAVCEGALRLTWNRDPFDRLISAHAAAVRSRFVTKDESIRQNLPLAWWGASS